MKNLLSEQLSGPCPAGLRYPEFVRHIRMCLTEARPCVQVIYLLRFLAGFALVQPDYPAGFAQLLLGATSWTCSTIAVYLFNGVADREEDIVNGSIRPIASGLLPVRSALTGILASASVGLMCAMVLDIGFLLLTTGYLLIGYAYSGRPFSFKRNYRAATMAGIFFGLATYLAGSLAAGDGVTADMAIFSAAMSLWMGVVGVIAKDLSDVKGDLAAGRHSLPIVLGQARARVLLALAALLVAVTFSAAALLWATRLLGSAAAVSLGAVAVTAASLSTPTNSDRSSGKQPYRMFMYTQYASHLMLGITLWLVAWR